LSQLKPDYEPKILDRAIGLFQNWGGDLAPDSPTAALYEVFIRRMLFNLFDAVVGDTSVDPNLAHRFVGAGPHPLLAANSYYGSNGRALLFNLIDEPQMPSFEGLVLDDLIWQSLREAVDFLGCQLGSRVDDWRWGDLHKLTLAHPLGQVRPLDRIFNRGPYPIGGDETTIWATGSYYHSLDCDHMIGPVCRFVVDLADFSRSRSLNVPGQSGQPGSRHYADRIHAWFQGDYHPLLYHRLEVMTQAEATLHLIP
jgi:penicillin amidase